MKQEIKFRAKDIEHKDWCYGIIHNNGINLFPVEVDTNTIGQFTGLYDKNGNEIYDGDIVRSCKYKNIKHIVSYEDKVASFLAVCIDENIETDLENKCHITQEWIDNYPKEVIGNIFDNKELLKEE